MERRLSAKAFATSNPSIAKATADGGEFARCTGVADRNIVYLLQSEQHPQQHYVGLTQNVRRRLAAHNAGRSTHTAKHRPWRVVIAVWFGDAARARSFERYLKSGSGRAFAKRHFQGTFP